MSLPKRHHYVPQFLLRRWVNDDGELPLFRRCQDGVVRPTTSAPKGTAFVEFLYSLEGVPDDQRQIIETKFFAEHVDTKGAGALEKMLADGVGSLSPAERIDWTVFLIAARLRVPNIVEQIKSSGQAHVEAGLLADAEEYKAVRGRAPETNLL